LSCLSTVLRPTSAPLFPSTTLFRSWWLWAVVAALLCDQALRLAVPAYRQRTDRWLKPGWRGALSVVAAAVVALVGGYLAYRDVRSEEHTSELQSRENPVCRLLPGEK